MRIRVATRTTNNNPPHTSNRIPSLDGFRAISIAMVLFGHLSGTQRFPGRAASLVEGSLGDIAFLGVVVFFVISGFLITSLLMREYNETGAISLKQFYLRRVLRIFPAFYTFILLSLLASTLGWIHLIGRDFIFALTYSVNYDSTRPWQFGHLWSLSVEEQFYLIWPLALILLRERRSLILAIAAIFIGPMVRVAISEYISHVNPHSMLSNTAVFPAMFDYLATGCALALLRPWLLTQRWYLCLTASRWLILIVPLVFAINRIEGYMAVMLFGSPVLNVCLALLIEACTRHSKTLVGRFLNWKPIAALGVLSYSLYLWQQPFINRYSSEWINTFPQNLLLAFIAALLSYFIVERAFLRLRNRHQRTAELPTSVDGIHPVVASTTETVGATAIPSAPRPPMP